MAFIQGAGVVFQLGFQLFDTGFQLKHRAGGVSLTAKLRAQLSYSSDQLFFFSHDLLQKNRKTKVGFWPHLYS